MNELTDEQKSMALARLVGVKFTTAWGNGPKGRFVSLPGIIPRNSFIRDGVPFEKWEGMPNLYDPANMELLAKVLKCLNDKFGWQWRGEALDSVDFDDLHKWMCQCADYGLQLATEAGMVEA